MSEKTHPKQSDIDAMQRHLDRCSKHRSELQYDFEKQGDILKSRDAHIKALNLEICGDGTDETKTSIWEQGYDSGCTDKQVVIDDQLKNIKVLRQAAGWDTIDNDLLRQALVDASNIIDFCSKLDITAKPITVCIDAQKETT